MSRHGVVLAALAASCLFGGLGACSANTNTDDDGFSGSGAGDSSSGNAGGDSVGSFSGGVGGATGSGGMDACASEVFDGVQVPLDMYVMLDKSSSMSSDSKWQNVTSALNTFFTDPGSAGIGVGLQFFPLPSANPPPSSCMTDQDCGAFGPCIPPPIGICLGAAGGGDSCEPMDYATPEEAIATLPGAAGALQSKMNGESPDGASTPTGVALAGARQYATQWAAANPTHLTYILFVTDGDPTGCSGDAQSEAAQAAAANPPVRTFVIGVGPELTFLNGVAQAGGTGQAFLVDAGPNTTQQFLDALADLPQHRCLQSADPPAHRWGAGLRPRQRDPRRSEQREQSGDDRPGRGGFGLRTAGRLVLQRPAEPDHHRALPRHLRPRALAGAGRRGGAGLRDHRPVAVGREPSVRPGHSTALSHVMNDTLLTTGSPSPTKRIARF